MRVTITKQISKHVLESKDGKVTVPVNVPTPPVGAVVDVVKNGGQLIYERAKASDK